MSEYTSTTVHEGSMRCVSTFPQGNAVFTTDVGAALGGKGEQPSPAQLLAAAVASCMASMMAFMGARRHLNTEGVRIEAGYEEGKITVEAGKETITFEKSQVALVRLRVEF